VRNSEGLEGWEIDRYRGADYSDLRGWFSLGDTRLLSTAINMPTWLVSKGWGRTRRPPGPARRWAPHPRLAHQDSLPFMHSAHRRAASEDGRSTGCESAAPQIAAEGEGTLGGGAAAAETLGRPNLKAARPCARRQRPQPSRRLKGDLFAVFSGRAPHHPYGSWLPHHKQHDNGPQQMLTAVAGRFAQLDGQERAPV
jgi:hypothetical protein